MQEIYFTSPGAEKRILSHGFSKMFIIMMMSVFFIVRCNQFVKYSCIVFRFLLEKLLWHFTQPVTQQMIQ